MTVVFPPLCPEQYWTWQDQGIHFVQMGQGQPDRPALLLIHGFGASTDHWRKNIEFFQEEYEVWAIDLLGFGRSAKPVRSYQADLWREQIIAFIREKIQKPTVVAGNSLGGYVALTVAAHLPETIAGVILLNSAGPFGDANQPPLSPVRGVVQKAMGSFFRQPWGSWLLFQYLRQPETIRKTLRKVYWNPAAVTDRLIAEIQRPACDPGAAQVFASVFQARQGETVDQLLGNMTCPLLTLWGEKDPWMRTRDRGAKFRQYYPQLTEHYLESGHCPHDDTPNLVNPLIAQWLKTAVLSRSAVS